MIHLHDRAAIERAATLDLDPALKRLLARRVAALHTRYGDLTDWTEFLVVEPEDTEADLVRHVGLSPLLDPVDGHRWPDPAFRPGWDAIADRGGWFELTFTFGSTFAYVLFIADNQKAPTKLSAMCRAFIDLEPDRE
jgi:hypothetical protein